MNSKEFNNIDEIQKYYDKETNTYVFKDYVSVVFSFDLNINSNIIACDIYAKNIKARNINAWDIYARDIIAHNIIALDVSASDINANDIDAWNIYAFNIIANNIIYYAVCVTYKNIKCKSIKRIEGAKHFVLDGEIEVVEDE